jgi:ligand-binding sensor domain-containing protein/signal transduction histidine kinase
MRTGNRIAFLVLLSLLAAPSRTAVAEMPPVRVYTAADGLAAYDVYGILADSRGFLWFRTVDGLSRFDGYAFTTYTTEDGLPDRRVSEIVETRAGDYWVATLGGLCRFDPRGVRGSAESPPFVRVPIGEGEGAAGVNAVVVARDGALWVGTDAGLFRLEARDGGWVASHVDLGTRASVLGIVEDRHGEIWVAALEDKGVYRVGPGGVERQAMPEFATYFEPETVFEDRDGRLWVGARTGFCYAEPGEAGAPRVFVGSGPGAPIVWTTSFHQARDGTFFMGTTTGLWRAVATAGRFAFERVASLDGACDREVWDIAEDRDGNLWLATRCGALRVGRYGFTVYSAADGLGPLGLNSIFESRAGDLVVTTVHGKCVVLRFDGARFIAASPNVKTNNWGWGWGQTVLQDHTGAWWVPTGDGDFRFPGADRPEAALGARPERVYGGGQVFRAFEDSRGDVWLATTLPARLLRWERERGEIVELTGATGMPAGVEFSAFAESRDGGLWIGTSDGLLHYADGRFTALGAADGVPRGWLRALHLDLAGRLWIASSLGGLGRIDDPSTERPAIRVYRRADGLSTDNLHCVVDDAWGRIYVGTGRGVDRLDVETGRVKHFTAADGLPKGTVALGHRDRQGRLWFGAMSGLARFDPEPEREREPPRTLVTGLRVAGVARPVSALGESALADLDLGSTEDNVSVDFLGLGVSLGEELRYQYMLEGADVDWSAPSAERSVTFAHLAPGSYRFLVRAVDADGVASPAPAAVAFTVAAPVWQRWWFLALAAALAGAAIYALYRYRIARLLEVERVRTRIATDLHDDIGANLTKIAVLSEVANYRLGGDGDDSLAAIANISRESVTAMSDIVWAVNPGRDGLRDLTRRMRQFANEALVSGGVDVRFTGPEADDLRLGDELRRQVYLVFKEAVNNAVRHSGCTRVDVSLAVARDRLVLGVSDDGHGFDPLAEADGNGLINMRKRAAAVGAALDVRSGDGRGTTVTLSIPVRREGRFVHRHPT